MKLNTIIKAPDGRIGTICYNDLDGTGGVWGQHWFEMPPGGYGENLPRPQFMLRTAYGDRKDVEFVPEFEVIGAEETPEAA
jgi:hypothetical protein